MPKKEELKTPGEILLNNLKVLQSTYPSIFNQVKQLEGNEYIGTLEFSRHFLIANIVQKYAASNIYTMLKWRQYKKVYTFDDDLVQILNKQAESTSLDTSIPSDIFKHLPYDSIFISAKINQYSPGFFVISEPYDVIQKTETDQDIVAKLVFSFYLSQEQKNDICNYKDSRSSSITSISLMTLAELNIYKDGTIEDWFVKTEKSQDKFLKDNNYNQSDAIDRKGTRDTILKALTLFMYILAENSDIEKSEISKKQFKGISQKIIKDKYSEIEELDVGVKVGAALRKYKVQSYNNTDISSKNLIPHNHKSPHTRRAHWHHFWVGKKNSPERRLVLRWINVILVNTGTYNDINTIVTPVQNS